MEKKLLDCMNCGKDQPAQREDQQKWTFHLIMLLFTCGLWLPVMIYKAAKAPDPKWKCVKCGEVVEEPPSKFAMFLGFIAFLILNAIAGIVLIGMGII